MTTQTDLPATNTTKLDTLLADLKIERLAQITREGYTTEHDDAHTGGELAQAAAGYAYAGPLVARDERNQVQGFMLWPWPIETWKPGLYRSNLLRTGALVLAELERLDRLADTVRYWSVESDGSEIYAATSFESLIEHLRAEGTLPDDLDEIFEVSETSVGGADEQGTVKATLREIAIDVFGTGSYTMPFQIQSAYN